MPIVIGRHAIEGDLQRDVLRLEKLLTDMKAIASGVLPGSTQLATAPLIDHWDFAARSELCLVGKMTGHPHCGGPMSATSGIWVWAPELGWARTLSRYYRLGRPVSTQPSA